MEANVVGDTLKNVVYYPDFLRYNKDEEFIHEVINNIFTSIKRKIEKDYKCPENISLLVCDNIQ